MSNISIGIEVNSSTVEYQRAAFRKYQLIPLSVILIVGFVANIMVIHAGIKKSNKQKYTTNCFILNLAVADLGMTCFFITTQFIEYTVGLRVSNWSCQYIIPIRETFSTTSILTVAVLSVVRLLQVYLSRVLSLKFTNFIIAGMWFFTYSTVSFPLSFAFRHTKDDTCDPSWDSIEKKKIHVAFVNMVLLVPLLVTTLCYICIILKMRNFNRGFGSDEHNELEKKSQKVSILLFMLIITNWLGLAPYLIYSMIKVFGVNVYSKWPYLQWSIISVLFCSTSAINPILILIANKDYRKEIHRTFYKNGQISPLTPLQVVQIELKQENDRNMKSVQLNDTFLSEYNTIRV